MKKIPRSLRKYIRKEKARLRRESLDLKEKECQIKELIERFVPYPKDKKKVSSQKIKSV